MVRPRRAGAEGADDGAGAGVLAPVLPISPRCTHVKGHGGAKAAVREVSAALPEHKFVCRTDVKSYDASIDHRFLLDRLARVVPDRFILNLLYQLWVFRESCG